MVQYRAHKNPSLDFIERQLNPVQYLFIYSRGSAVRPIGEPWPP
jgi:hypothetical protein